MLALMEHVLSDQDDTDISVLVVFREQIVYLAGKIFVQ